MRDHMMGWPGAIARVNELHPGNRKPALRTIRPPMDADTIAARRLLDRDPTKPAPAKAEASAAAPTEAPQSTELVAGKVYLTVKTRPDGSKVDYFRCWLGDAWSLGHGAARRAAKQVNRARPAQGETITMVRPAKDDEVVK